MLDGLEPLVVIQHAAQDTRSVSEIFPKLSYDLTELRPHLSDQEHLVLLRASPDGRIFMRGVEPGADRKNVTRWRKIEMGDIALIAWDGYVRGMGEVVLRTQNPELAALRGGSAGHQYLYFLRHVEPLEIAYTALNRVLGFKEGNNFQRFTVMTEAQSKSAIGCLREIRPLAAALVRPFSVDYQMPEDLDGWQETVRRLEQSRLRRVLLGGQDEGKCALCGRVFPIGFLVAAHIKKRSLCSDAEKRDVRGNIMPACRLGCDELFERGYLRVENGRMRCSSRKPMSGAIRDYLAPLEGTTVEGWQTHAKYFEWHLEALQ
jgi:hypothetical protein